MLNLLDIKQVIYKLHVSRSTFHEMRKAGQFPPPVRLPNGSPRWREDVVDAWIDRLGQDDGSAQA